MTSLDSEAGKPHPESLRKHEPLINRRFIELFDHEDNADLKRAFTVGLPVADAPKPADPAPEAAPEQKERRTPGKRIVRDAVKYTDRDGDVMKLRRFDDEGVHGFLIDIAGNKVFLEDDLDGDVIVEWLNRRLGGGPAA